MVQSTPVAPLRQHQRNQVRRCSGWAWHAVPDEPTPGESKSLQGVGGKDFRGFRLTLTAAFQAVQDRDFNIVQTMTLYSALTVMLVNLLVDLSYARIDPRIRYR